MKEGSLQSSEASIRSKLLLIGSYAALITFLRVSGRRSLRCNPFQTAVETRAALFCQDGKFIGEAICRERVSEFVSNAA
jgi:hypothetical protein